jgi:hypothetical protein
MELFVEGLARAERKGREEHLEIEEQKELVLLPGSGDQYMVNV